MFLLLVALACLFPISLYCLFLALVHNRNRPTIVDGVWDMAGVIVALAGFLLVGGTVALFAASSAAKESFIRAQSVSDLSQAQAGVDRIIIFVWVMYAMSLIVCVVIALTLGARRLSIYNVTPLQMETILIPLVSETGLSLQRRGNRYYVGHGPMRTATTILDHDMAEPERRMSFEIDGSEPMRHTSLIWLSAGAQSRRDFEAELNRSLQQCASQPGTIAGWLITLSGSLMLLMLLALAIFLIITLI